MIVRPFVPDDIEQLVLQPAQAYLRPMVSGRGYGEALAQGEAWTGVDGGRVVACGGVCPLYGFMGNAWAMISADLKHHFVIVHRIAQRVLDAYPAQRIEAHIDVDFLNGHRWAEALGFALEAPRMRKFTPDGRDVALYARVR